MNVCPYANTSETCGLPSVNADHGSIVAYCQKCSDAVFRCASGHWNRAFARYCTQCRRELEKPAQWGMASGNPHRTATFSADSVDINLGLNSGVVDMPLIESGENLPGMLAIDGLFVLPNPRDKRLDAYTIINIKEGINLNYQWGIEFNTPLTHGLTPIYHGLHLYSVVSGGILKVSVVSGKTELINNINGVETDKIKPIPRCAPLKCDVNGKPAMIVGLDRGMLLFDFAKHDGLYIKNDFFHVANTPMSPTLCGTFIVFTFLRGGVFSLNTDTTPYKNRYLALQGRSFSAPVSLNGLVYFEALSDSGKRSLARFNPISGELSNVKDLDNEPKQNLEARLTLFTHPPLTDGQRLYLSDRSGHVVYTYDSDKGSYPAKLLPNEAEKHRFIPHQSIVVNNRIYSAHSSGLTVWEFERSRHVQTQPLSMGHPTTPTPVARPIRYGSKLLILCKDRFICRDY